MIALTINNLKWKVFVLPEETFTQRFKDGEAAVTLPDRREIIFSDEEINLVNVRHELFHSYRASLCTGSANLSQDQEEEVCAELFAIYGDMIGKQARILLKELKSE